MIPTKIAIGSSGLRFGAAASVTAEGGRALRPVAVGVSLGYGELGYGSGGMLDGDRGDGAEFSHSLFGETRQGSRLSARSVGA